MIYHIQKGLVTPQSARTAHVCITNRVLSSSHQFLDCLLPLVQRMATESFARPQPSNISRKTFHCTGPNVMNWSPRRYAEPKKQHARDVPTYHALCKMQPHLHLRRIAAGKKSVDRSRMIGSSSQCQTPALLHTNPSRPDRRAVCATCSTPSRKAPFHDTSWRFGHEKRTIHCPARYEYDVHAEHRVMGESGYARRIWWVE